MKNHICPCPNLDCPNHGNCEDCNSRHLKIGTLNCCSFYAVLNKLKDACNSSPESETAKQIDTMIQRHITAYSKLMEKHNISEEEQKKWRKEKADYSNY